MRRRPVAGEVLPLKPEQALLDAVGLNTALSKVKLQPQDLVGQPIKEAVYRMGVIAAPDGGEVGGTDPVNRWPAPWLVVVHPNQSR